MSLLREYGPYRNARIKLVQIGVGVGLPYELVERGEVQSEIQIVDERFLGVSDVDKCGVQRRHDLLDPSEEDISDRISVTLTGFLVELDQPVVFHQGDLDLLRTDVDYEVFFDFLSFHQEIAF